ncbi:MAG: hypothetical protein DRP79_04380 [Planctomycetota bacterium]|nr:MAG: hypothetical protein DRP79_04380 [Planctomycetota bacterium]
MTMNVNSRRKKEKERRIIERFLDHLDFKIEDLKDGEKPDFRATLRSNGKSLNVGIELTEYARPAGRRMEAIWDELEKHLEKYQPKYCPLRNLGGFITFKQNIFPPKRLCPFLAREILEFVAEHVDRITDGRTSLSMGSRDNPLIATWEDIAAANSSRYPNLKKYIGSMKMCNTLPGCWSCSGAKTEWIDVLPEELIGIINRYANKRIRYHWGLADEMWLVIHGGGSVHSAMSRPEKADTAELRSAAEKSGYDCIYLYEEFKDWCRCLWPPGLAG